MINVNSSVHLNLHIWHNLIVTMKMFCVIFNLHMLQHNFTYKITGKKKKVTESNKLTKSAQKQLH